ncbi:hypothetical protein ACWGQ5_35975 [Streptomyces sp. NPDC055722]
MVLIGVDPHKSSHTAVAVDAAGHQLAQRWSAVNAGTFRQLMRWCEQWPERRFAVEGARGPGRTLAQQLAAAGENVVDVPSTLSARARLLASARSRRHACRRGLTPVHAMWPDSARHDSRTAAQAVAALLTEARADNYSCPELREPVLRNSGFAAVGRRGDYFLGRNGRGKPRCRRHRMWTATLGP